MDIITGAVIFIFGIIIGSFLNVCILRLPEKRSIVVDPSSCPDCGSRLTAIDMVPVLSFLFLRGKCRHCGKKISAQYPAVEFLCGALFLLLYIKLGLVWQLPVYAALTAVLIIITFIDWRHMEIPNGPLIVILVIGIVQLAATLIFGVFEVWHTYVTGFFAGGLPLWLIALFCSYLLKKDAFGGGDVKLMAVAGLVIGWRLVITSYLIGIFAGAVFGVIMLGTGKKKRGDEIPFGPFLSLGIAISIFFGDEIISWYLGLL